MQDPMSRRTKRNVKKIYESSGLRRVKNLSEINKLKDHVVINRDPSTYSDTARRTMESEQMLISLEDLITVLGAGSVGPDQNDYVNSGNLIGTTLSLTRTGTSGLPAVNIDLSSLDQSAGVAANAAGIAANAAAIAGLPAGQNDYVSAVTLTGNTLSLTRTGTQSLPALSQDLSGLNLKSVLNTYASQAAMIADQPNQVSGGIYFVTGDNYYFYAGTTAGTIADYAAIINAGGGAAPVAGVYADEATLIGDQNNQDIDFIYQVTTGGQTEFVRYLGAISGDITDYEFISNNKVYKLDHETDIWSIGIGSDAPDADSIVIGTNAGTTTGVRGTASIAIGNSAASGVETLGQQAIAIGDDAKALEEGNISIGSGSRANASNSIAIGIGTGLFKFNNNIPNSVRIGSGSSLYVFAGSQVGSYMLGTTNPTNNLTAAVNGCVAYNSTLHRFEGYVQGAWTPFLTAGGIWTDISFSAVAFPNTEVNYRIIGDRVYIRMKVGDSVSTGDLIATIPTNARPTWIPRGNIGASPYRFPLGFDANGAVAVVSIQPAGGGVIIFVEGGATFSPPNPGVIIEFSYAI